MNRLALAALGCLVFGALAHGGEQPLLIVSTRTGNPDLILINPDTGDAKNLTNHPAADTMPAWSPDGRHIAFSSDRAGGNNLFLMDADGGNLRQLTHEKAGVGCFSATWSSDGKRIAYSRAEGDGHEVWVVGADGKRPHRLASRAGHPTWSPDGKQIAFVSVADGFAQSRLCVMNANGSHVHPLTTDYRGTMYPAWSPDGQWIVFSCMADGVLELFLIHPDGAGLRRLTYLGWMNAFPAWSADGRGITFVHAQPDQGRLAYMRIDVAGTRLGPSLLAGPHLAETPAPAFGRPAWKPAAESLAAIPMGPPAPSESAGDAVKASVMGRFAGHGAWVADVVFAPDGKRLASGGREGRVGFWNFDGNAGQSLGLDATHSAEVWSVAWAPDGKTLATASFDKTVRLWDPERRTVRVTLDDHQFPVLTVAYSADGQTLVSGAGDGFLKVRDAADGKVRQTLELPGAKGQSVAALALLPDSKTVLAGGLIARPEEKGVLAAWDLATGQLRWSIPVTSPGVGGLAIAPDGQTIAAACLDGTIRLFDPEDGHERSIFTGHVDRAVSVAFTPDGQTLISCGFDNTIRLWDVATGKQRALLAGHMLPVQRISLSSDGKHLASAGADGLILIWRLEE